MRKSSRMAPKEKQKIEIEKTHRDPLLSFNQAVTVDCSDFLGTALMVNCACTILLRRHQPSICRVHVRANILDQCALLPRGCVEDPLRSLALHGVRKRTACGGAVVKTNSTYCDAHRPARSAHRQDLCLV